MPRFNKEERVWSEFCSDWRRESGDGTLLNAFKNNGV